MENERINEAKKIAQKIIDGFIDPSEGCDQIGKIAESLDYCDELLQFIHLSHLHTDHEKLGFNKENLKRDILIESEKLIKST